MEKVYLRTKNSRLRAFLFISFIGCSVLLTSCFDKGDCLFSNSNVVKINLLDIDTVSQAEKVIFDAVFTPGVGYYYAQDTVSSLYLVVDPTKTEMKYVFQYEGRSDTLVLGYTNQTIVLAPDCGSALFQDNLEVKHNTFGLTKTGTEKLTIKNKRLLTSVKVNIEILL